MAVTTGIVGAVVAGYGAYNSKRQGDRMAGIAGSQASRQAYFAQELIDLMNNPDSIFDDPGYQAMFAQGTQAAERSLAAAGLIGSGNAAIELQQFGQSFANTYYRDQQRLLAGLSGAQFNPAQAGAVAQQSYNDSFDQFGAMLSSLGYAFGGTGTKSTVGETQGFGGATTVPGTMEAGGGYIYNIPGA